jgi:16S rRNA processing protein RimM
VSRPPSQPKARTTPPRPAPTAPASDDVPSSPPGKEVEAAQRRGEGAGREDARRVTLAAIIGAHGIAGEVRLKLFTDDLGPYKRFNDGALTLKSLRHGGNGSIARFAEIVDRTAAERMRGTELTVPRSELPPLEEGEYYHADLLGLVCITDAGDQVGTVKAVENFGAGDLIDVERGDGRCFLVPVEAAVIGDVVTFDSAFAE